MSDSSTKSSGIGFFGLLTIVFITLKLTNYIKWSWLWVLAPLWGPATAVVIFFVLASVFFFIRATIKARKTSKSKEQHETSTQNNPSR